MSEDESSCAWSDQTPSKRPHHLGHVNEADPKQMSEAWNKYIASVEKDNDAFDFKQFNDKQGTTGWDAKGLIDNKDFCATTLLIWPTARARRTCFCKGLKELMAEHPVRNLNGKTSEGDFLRWAAGKHNIIQTHLRHYKRHGLNEKELKSLGQQEQITFNYLMQRIKLVDEPTAKFMKAKQGRLESSSAEQLPDSSQVRVPEKNAKAFEVITLIDEVDSAQEHVIPNKRLRKASSADLAISEAAPHEKSGANQRKRIQQVEDVTPAVKAEVTPKRRRKLEK